MYTAIGITLAILLPVVLVAYFWGRDRGRLEVLRETLDRRRLTHQQNGNLEDTLANLARQKRELELGLEHAKLILDKTDALNDVARSHLGDLRDLPEAYGQKPAP
ncbi:MAG: hypothetical protein DWQ07_12910 [Chloroflexi bacterium]|nr:MAG: hypothetical protein DWQ07_12910 [Chloroflexota bacterium]MBL1196940.1 hypothetical protein [Chloroflexota bacterium]